MLKIHKTFSKHKLFIISITSILSIGAFLGLSSLIYTPELSYAETVTYPEKETRTMDDITYMQEITPEICANSILNQQYTLLDRRDGNTYTVARIKNNTNNKTNCWMTQNLRLVGNKLLTSDTSDVTTDYTLPASSGLNSNSFSSSDINKSRVYYDNSIVNGAYYNWFTATAGTGNLTTANNVNVNESICPKNWKLPPSMGENDSGYFDFLYGLNANIITSSPYKFVKAGYIFEGQFFDKGSAGRFWSSSRRNTGFTGLLVFDNNTSFGGDFNLAFSSGNRYPGYSVRCATIAAEFKLNNNINTIVAPVMSLNMAEEVTVERSEANPSTAELDVKVSSNQPYTVAISANDPVMRSSTASVTIPAKGGLLNTAENGWGIKLKESGEYMAVTNDLQIFYTASGAEVKTIPFTIGISTAPDIPNGEYSTDITVTVTQN